MCNPKYLVDASIMILRDDEETYEELAYPIHWKNFDKLIEHGKIISIKEVEKELTREGHDEHKDWVNKYQNMFKPIDTLSSEFLTNYLSLEYKDWYIHNQKKGSIADAPLIAYAKTHDLVLVTDEVYNYTKDIKPYKYKIPVISEFIGAKCFMKSCETVYDLNKTYDFECICFNELVKREKLYCEDLFKD